MPEEVAALSLSPRLAAEFAGTAFLVAIVVGSGISAQQLSPGDVGLQLLENAAATAAGLVALILALAPISGAHFNPVVTAVDLVSGGMSRRDALAYVGAQLAGAVTGAIVANLMFGLRAVAFAQHARSAPHLWLGEVVATLGLVVVVFTVARSRSVPSVAIAVGGYIGAAYFFTSSTSFANPAVTVGRALTDTFAGIRPSSVPAFVGAQLMGGALGAVLVRFLATDS